MDEQVELLFTLVTGSYLYFNRFTICYILLFFLFFVLFLFIYLFYIFFLIF